MTAKALTFELAKGRDFIAGLFWQPLISISPKDARSEAADVAEQMNMDMVVFRFGENNQAGLCARDDSDAKSGVYSSAATIAASVETEGVKNALVAVPIGDSDDRWIYVAIRDGMILSDGDMAGTEDDVRAAMHAHHDMSDWDLVVAPSYWAFRHSVERTFVDFIQKDKKERLKYKGLPALSPIKLDISLVIKKAVPILMIAVVLGAGGIYGWKYMSAEKQRLAAEAAAKLAFKKSQELPPPPPPWINEPSGVALASACMSAMNKFPLSPGGWQLKQMGCSRGGISAEWTRPPYATVAGIRAEIPGVVIGKTGDTAAGGIPLGELQPEKEEVGKAEDAVGNFHNQSQQLGLGGTIDPVPIPPDQQGIAKQTWQSFKWALTTKLPPDEVAQWLSFAGFRISAITVSYSDGLSTWKMDGIQYAKR